MIPSRPFQRSSNDTFSSSSKKRIVAWFYFKNSAFLLCSLFSILCFAFVVADLNHNIWARQGRLFLTQTSTPLLQSVQQFGKKLHAFEESLLQLFSTADLSTENKALKVQQADLIQKINVLTQENQRLKEQLGFKEPSLEAVATTRILTHPQLPYYHTFSIPIGATQGLKHNQPVVTSRGVLGRITEVHDKTARVLLLSDTNSRIPVQIFETRENAILAGNHSGKPELALREKDTELPKGARIVTSGKGGVFQPGLLVGYVENPSSERIRLVHENPHKIDFVTVLEKYADAD